MSSYICIDLKSFYASVECIERGLDPMDTNLVVADKGRTEKTICLAVTPSLKSLGVSGRARLFEVIQKVRLLNEERRRMIPNHSFTGASFRASAIERDKTLSVDYITAKPRMALYMEYSTRIYQVYLKYIAPEDIHVYSIDEVFIDVTKYLSLYDATPKELASRIINDVLSTTGITATAGVGTNMYLAKIAMDIVAKHTEPDENGVRIAELDEMSYRRELWSHRPLTDFWRVGIGYAAKLEEQGIYTMGDVARCSVGGPNEYYNEDLLYRIFGVNAELLIDHAWGYEPCTIADIKAYKPASNSISSGQVLTVPYDFTKARLVCREMTDLSVLDLVEKGIVTDQVVLTVGYDVENLTDPSISKMYNGPVTTDHYGRSVPKHAHGTVNLPTHTSSSVVIIDAVTELFERIVNKELLVRRITLAFCRLVDEKLVQTDINCDEQLDLFTDYEAKMREEKEAKQEAERERRRQKTVIKIKNRFGKNAIMRGMNLEDGATAKERNEQIGGHKA